MTVFPGWLFTVLLPIVVALAVAVFFFVRAARKARRTGDPSPVVSVTLSVSAVVAGVSVMAAVSAAIAPFLPMASVSVPTWDFWPALPEGIELEGMTAERVGGGFREAALFLDGLSTGARVCLAIGGALGWLVPGAIAALIGVACFQLLAGRAFAPVVARVTIITAVVVLVGGIAAGVLNDVGSSLAAQEALAWTSASVAGDRPGDAELLTSLWPRPAWRVDVPVWPIGAGLGLAALSAVFRYGAGLQRDTEGLV
ncbi:hypothetical protein [Microbacterium sp. No. 7]|uniref:hypothetical protein n=1 Tax=Microbacterium sp. No. 7 TaxID=1714373 RepID=UPI0006D0D683|nr:hypothetical protein [Microbacterium sp. No. 7]ALJ21997.1 hypothetical protein AOA12_19705 [Microbacterium sp. No. 7]